MYFPEVTEQLLRSLLHIQEQYPVEWKMITDWMREQCNNQIADHLHSFPSNSDVNYRSRIDISRGIAISLDVLQRIFSDPIGALEDIKTIDKLGTPPPDTNPIPSE